MCCLRCALAVCSAVCGVLCAVCSATHCSQDIVRCLLREEVGCDVTLRNEDGESALDMIDSNSSDSSTILILLQEKLVTA